MFSRSQLAQFDIILERVKPDLKNLSFCKQVSCAEYEQEYYTYRRRVKYKDFIYFDIGFGHNEDKSRAWYYITFLLYKPKSSAITAEQIAALLAHYNFNDRASKNYRVVAVENFTHWTPEKVIDTKEITNWFKSKLQEVKDKEDKIYQILNF